jgi:hypothetical protein
MKTHYKYLHFRETPNPGRKTTKWDVMNTNEGDHLGYIYWYGAWRQYVFSPFLTQMAPYDSIILNNGCLDDIGDFLNQLNKAQRGKWKSKDGSK